jgi:hypothetical protein
MGYGNHQSFKREVVMKVKSFYIYGQSDDSFDESVNSFFKLNNGIKVLFITESNHYIRIFYEYDRLFTLGHQSHQQSLYQNQYSSNIYQHQPNTTIKYPISLCNNEE